MDSGVFALDVGSYRVPEVAVDNVLKLLAKFFIQFGVGFGDSLYRSPGL